MDNGTFARGCQALWPMPLAPTTSAFFRRPHVISPASGHAVASGPGHGRGAYWSSRLFRRRLGGTANGLVSAR